MFERILEVFRGPISESIDEPPTTDAQQPADLAGLTKQWEVVVGVQKHFNDLEWRIRSLALTALTAIVGFAIGTSVATKFIAIGTFKVGFSAFLGVLGAAIWTAFFMSDYKWYHPMLGGAGLAANALEEELGSRLGIDPEQMLSHQIYTASKRSAWRKNREIHSGQKLKVFYSVGYLILLALIAWNLVDLNLPAPPTGP